MKRTLTLTVMGALLLLAAAYPAAAQGVSEDEGVLSSEETLAPEPAAPEVAAEPEALPEASAGEESVAPTEEPEATGELPGEPLLGEAPEGGEAGEATTPEGEVPTGEAAEASAGAQETGTVTISPDLAEVQRLQREVETLDPGANMSQRVQVGSQVPVSVIGEGESEAPQVYIVKSGDTLWDISARFLNDPFRWTGIHKDNPQIIDPDLIYPGEPITVYPRDYEEAAVRVVQLLPPPELERSAEAGEEEVTSEEIQPEVEFEVIEEAEPSEEDLAQRDRYLDELTKREELKIFDEAATELISKKRAVLSRRQRNVIEYRRAPAAGWIEFMETSALNNAGYILGQEDEFGRIRGAPGDLVYINRGEINGVAVGDRYQIFRIGNEVRHPVTKQYIGHKIIVVGFLQVETVQERTAAARITEAFEDVSVGNERLAGVETYDRIVPEFDVPTEYRLRQNDQDIRGWVIAAREYKEAMADRDVAYIDRGTADGVEVGNVFDVYRPNRKVHDPEVGDKVQLPRFHVGEVLVIRSDANSSAVLILRVRREVMVGDEISIAPLTLEEEEAPPPTSASLLK